MGGFNSHPFHVYIKKKIYKMKQTWKDLEIKDKLAVGTALAAFAAGWLLTGIAAFVPLLLSEQSILWILGQSLVYSASVFGVAAYFRSESVQLRRDMDNHLAHTEKMIIEREKLRHGIDVGEMPDINIEKDEE